jgi:hypothetical protein
MNKKLLLRNFSSNIITGVALLIYLFVMSPSLSSGIQNYSNLEQNYDGINSDFIVSGPRIDQINALKSDDNITEVTPFYELKIYFDGRSEIPSSIVRSIPGLDNQSGHLFSKEKTLDSLNADLASNSILIDSIIAGRYELSVGSPLNLSFNDYSFNFIVHSIYSPIPMYDNGIAYFLFSNQFENALKSIIPKLYFSGAYINAINNTNFINYLRDEYLPLGRLGFREDYNDESVYEIIYDNIIANYQYNVDNIFIFQLVEDSNIVLLDLFNDNQRRFLFHSIILGFIFNLNFFLIIPLLNKLKKNFNSVINQIKSDIFTSSTLFIIGTTGISILNLESHNFSNLSNSFLYFIIASIVGVAFYIVLSIITIRQFKHVQVKTVKNTIRGDNSNIDK